MAAGRWTLYSIELRYLAVIAGVMEESTVLAARTFDPIQT
jgi:hypothetical protein